MHQQHRLLLRSNQRTPPNQTLRLRPHFQSPRPSLLATRRLRTPPPHLRRALRWILHRQNQGHYRFHQEPTDEVLRKKKKKEEGELWNVLEFEEWQGTKKRREEG